MAKVKITELAETILSEFLSQNKLELYNVEFVKEGKDRFLRVYIDKAQDAEDEYVDTDDCELVSRYLSEKLDEEDPIEDNYYLEVSSPGLDRTLFREKDYKRFRGNEVEVSLYIAYEGRKKYEGVLIDLDNGILSLAVTPDPVKGKTKEKMGPERIDIPFEKVAKTKLKVVF